MTSLVADARARLHAALIPLLSDGRVHAHAPKNIATPCIWIGRPRLTTRVQGRASAFIVCSFTITIAVDGDDTQQSIVLDDLVSQVWDAVDVVTGAQALNANPRSLDIGGPNTTGMDVSVDVSIAARSLCPPVVMTIIERNNAHA